jgi:hypothetical protein
MILIDEYDRYANKLLLENPSSDTSSLINNITVNPLRSLFETLKSIDNLKLNKYLTFVCGLTPVALADASGANVWKNISHELEFADWCGFYETDLVRALQDINCVGDDQQVALFIMKKFYNGYKFRGSTQPLYQPQLSLDFLSNLVKGELTIDVLKSFQEKLKNNEKVDDSKLVDQNSKASENVLRVLAKLPALRLLDIFTDQFDALESTNQPKQNAYKLCYPILSRNLTDPNLVSDDEVVSFLYYHGWLTIEREIPGSLLCTFRIPNLLTWPLFVNS